MPNKKEINLSNYLNKSSNSSNQKRKLAAIMFTDIVGFTALSAKDETKAINLLSLQRKILDPIIKKYKGMIHKEIGDGLLLTFATVSDAVNCGVKIQNELKAEKDLNIRIGIHEGEITLKNGDVLGDDVNIASRIQEYSPIGGIVISNKIQQNIVSLNKYKTKYIGSPKLKGVIQDIKLYCIISHNLPINFKKFSNYSIAKNITFPFLLIFTIMMYLLIFKSNSYNTNNIPSIGIVMFENICNEKDNFWINGYNEDLILEIAKSGIIKVEKIENLNKIKFNNIECNYILTNSICKKDSIIELRSNLIDNNKGNSIFTQKWEKNTSESDLILFKLSNKILKAIDPKFKNNSPSTIKINSKAKELYYLAKEKYFEKNNYDDLLEAKILLQSSMLLDSNYIGPRNLFFSLKVDIGEFDDLTNFTQKTYSIATSIKDTVGMIRAIQEIVYIDTTSFEYRKSYLDKGVQLAKLTKNFQLLAEIYYSYGKAYYFEHLNRKKTFAERKKLKNKALENYLLAEQFYIIADLNQFGLFNSIGDIYRETEQKDKAYKYYVKAITYGEKNNYQYGAYHQAKMQIGGILSSQKKYVLSNGHLQDAYKYYSKTKNKMGIYHTLGYMLTNYSKLSDKDMIDKYYPKYLQVSELINDDFYFMGCYNTLYVIFEELNEQDLSLKYLKLFKESQKRWQKKNE